MAKIERGRLDGVWGMRKRTASELREWAEELEAKITDPDNADDPKWLRRWAERLRRLATKKEQAIQHKERQAE